jgi:peptidoglycan/LPS O-acetylase OafA/YrhL
VSTTSRTSSTANTADSGARPRRPYVHAVDVVRLITFVCVVGVHAVSMAMNPEDVTTGAAVSLLHFTRGAFFILSAFVLTYAQADRSLDVRRFWPRRFLYVGVPYLVWSVVYWWIAVDGVPRLDDIRQLGVDVITGTANYHLYFLLVSLQLYLLFPLLLWVVRRTRGHHGVLLAVSGLAELGLLALTHYPAWPAGWTTLQADVLVLSPVYQFYFVLGALAAVHHERLRAWVRGHGWVVVGALVAAGALHVGVYLLQLASGDSVQRAYDPLQPSVVPWTVAVTLGLYAWGCAYADRRRSDGRLARFVGQASLASFGVFLVHPLFLNTVLGGWFAWGSSTLNPTLAGVLAWSGTLVLAFAFAVVAIRTPLALPLTGRPRLPTTPRRRSRHV